MHQLHYQLNEGRRINGSAYHLKLQLKELLLLLSHLGVTIISGCILLLLLGTIITVSLLRCNVRFARASSSRLLLPALQCWPSNNKT
jgi:hypothetical protein